MGNKGKYKCDFCHDYNTDTKFVYNQSLKRYQKITECFNDFCMLNNLSDSKSSTIQDLKKTPELKEKLTNRFFDNLIKKKDEDKVR